MSKALTKEHVRKHYSSGAVAYYESGAPVRMMTPEESAYAAQRFDEWLAEVERAAAARARGEALIEVVQAHRDLHKTYGSTSACRVGIGGQALTAHCGEICYNADAHQKEMEAWQKLEVEAIEYSRARAEAYRQEREEQ